MNASHRSIIFFLLIMSYTLFSTIVIQRITQPRASSMILSQTKRDYYAMQKHDIQYAVSGYIKAESYTDTRQTTEIPEEEITDLYPYFPLDRNLDPLGQDIFGVGQTQLDVFDTRVRAHVTNIKINNAIVSALFETNIFAISLAVPNIIVLRHAYIEADWEKTTLVTGVTNHPISFAIPNTINYNGIVPFTFYSRSAQCTYTRHTSIGLDLIASINSAISFQNAGPFNGGGSEIFDIKFTQNAIIPNLHFHTRYQQSDYIVGGGVDYIRIVPQIETKKGYDTSRKLNSLVGTAYFLVDKPNFYIHGALLIGQNPVQHGSIGGYAITKGSIDPITDERKYTNLLTAGAWMDMVKNMSKYFQIGLFTAFQKRVGASEKIELNVRDAAGKIIETRIFGFATNVDLTYRISPRIIMEVGSVNFAVELEFTRAYYGTNNENGHVVNTHPVSNARIIVASFYYF